MKQVAVSQFHARVDQYLDQLDAEGLVITRDGEPIAKVVPFRRNNADLLGSLRDEIKVVGDILTTDLDWESGA